MTDFIISTQKLEGLFNKTIHAGKFYIYISDSDYKISNIANSSMIIIGDLINKEELSENINIQNLKGNLYIIKVKEETIELYNSMFGVLPIYYSENNQLFSNSIQLIKQHSGRQLTIDKQFILESLLFNYSFANRTFYNEIKLLDSNSFVKIENDKTSIIKHTEISDYFVETPLKGKKIRKQLAEKFIETTKSYFPDKEFSITFTSGFDGRTLVSCAKYFKKTFSTCSSGAPDNEDVVVPQKNTKDLNIPYRFYNLHSEEYLKTEYLKHSQSINLQNPGFNGFIYPHFSYFAEQEKQYSDYLLTGYFGSELFRALHIGGAVTSDVLVKIFSCNDKSETENYIRNSQRLKLLNLDLFKTELSDLIEEIRAFKNSFPKQFTVNQNFYKYVFEEVFRKLFGSIINAQMQFINIRTPFIDFDFVKEILKTKYAGVNNDFFTHNPLKRFKGQTVYAEIIKQTSSELFKLKTGKGYSPENLLNIFHSIKVILPFVKKKIKRKAKPQNIDNLGIISGISNNRTYFTNNQSSTEEYFHTDNIKKQIKAFSPFVNELLRDNLTQVCSLYSN